MAAAAVPISAEINTLSVVLDAVAPGNLGAGQRLAAAKHELLYNDPRIFLCSSAGQPSSPGKDGACELVRSGDRDLPALLLVVMFCCC